MLIWDPITVLNLVLCIVILALGIIGYRKRGDSLSLFIGTAFGLFGISHLVFLLGFKDQLEVILMWIRTLAYLIVAVAMMRIFTE